MAEQKKSNKPNNPLIGATAKPTVLDSTTKLDIDTNKTLLDNIIDASIKGGLDISALENFTSISNSRDQLYQMIDSMAQDSSVSSILRTFTEDVCDPNDNGHIVWCESPDPKISKFVNYLLNVMNVDKNIYGWVYSLLKYGDLYLRLYRESDYEDIFFKKDNIKNRSLNEGFELEEEKESLDESVRLAIHPMNDPYSYYLEAVADPSTMFELNKYGKVYGYVQVPNVDTGLDPLSGYTGLNNTSTIFNFKLKSSDVTVWQADDFVHACLEDNHTRYPETVELFMGDESMEEESAHKYSVRRGKSLLQDSYKIWREKSLLENAVLLNRVTRSSVVRKVSVEVGDMPKEQVQQTLRRVKELMEQKTAINTGNGMSEYTNPGPMENNIYFATHNGQGAITVESVGGDIDVKNIADLDFWNTKFYSAYGIPKAFMGWVDDAAGFNGGSSLSVLSSIYAKSVRRVQNAILQALSDAINLFLLNRGCKTYLNNFVLKMKTPLTQDELDYRANIAERISAISSAQALFTDVEDKKRRLTILKTLIGQLNYGDEVMEAIQQEIEATEAQEAKEAEEAANAETEGGDADLADTDTGDEEPEEGGDDMDLAPMPMEGLTGNGGESVLLEDGDGNDFIVLEESDDLPSPEQLDEKRDFSENN
ncbi:MAG: portal protein [Lachnospiraceae bacterium]|nr:portal protein [Lachnospiraceae bacterium]